MPDPLVYLLVLAALALVTFWLFRPERGLVPRWQESQRNNDRVRVEDLLKHVHKCERQGTRPSVESIAGALNVGLDATAHLLAETQHSGLMAMEQGEIRLTAKGRESALHIIRAHRLWERYLADETGYAESDWHGRAEKLEHLLTPEEVDALAAQLGNPTHDPHGDPIPRSDGEFVAHGGQPLSTVPVDTMAHIVHLEDEPEIVYAQIVAEGIHPGMVLQVLESNGSRVKIWVDGDEHILAPIVANNISVRPLPAEVSVEPEALDTEQLTALHLGERAEVVSISAKCRGAERRRFMDLGILPGTQVRAEIRSPSGDPTAFLVRGALIALRRDQAKLINIVRSNE